MESVKIATLEVRVVGFQEIDPPAVASFLEDHGAADWSTDSVHPADSLVEIAGRLCYLSFAKPRPGGNAAYINHILEVGHGSVLEHVVFNLIVTGVSRSFSHELVRHRAGFGFSQLSQRYVDEGDTEFVVPPALEYEVAAAVQHMKECGSLSVADCWTFCDPSNEVKAGLDWLGAMGSALEDYKALGDYLFSKFAHIKDRTARRKAAREAARSVLPNATETKLFVTVNARALRHFVEMRAHPAADAEIRRVAVAVLDAVRPLAPAIFGDYVVDREAFTVTTPNRKV